MKTIRFALIFVLCSACTLVTDPGEFNIGDSGPDSPSTDARMDAGMDAGSCSSAEECPSANGATVDCLAGSCVLMCEGGRADCDEVYANGCEVDISTDLTHCGSCGTSCDVAGATEMCLGGECIFECIPGRGDCDGLAATGCEASLNGPGSCGGCGTMCVEGTPLCNDNMDGSFSCVMNCGALTECEGSCLDTATQPENCGGCGIVCDEPDRSLRTCAGSVCDFSCEDGFGNCNGDAADGCEVAVSNTVTDCGSCGNVCEGGNAAWACEASACVPSCNTGFDNCNSDISDGCEAELASDSANCGGCNMACDGMCVDGVCDPVVDVGISEYRGCAMRTSGEVYCWGLNPRGELGDASGTARALPHRVLLGSGDPLIGTSLGVGTYHACVVNPAGEVFCWGAGTYGSAGQALSTSVLSPMRLTGDAAFEAATFVQVVSGSWNSCALSSGGQVWCWGRNLEGQLGLGGVTPSSTEVPTLVPGLSTVESISSAANAQCALLSDGTVSCWGWNRLGVCGHGAVGSAEYRMAGDIGLTGITQIGCGGSHCGATNAAGEYFYWGSGSGFAHGIVSEAVVSTPQLNTDIGDVSDLSAGSEITCANVGGEPRCWGRRNSGAVGDGTSGGATAVPVLPVGLLPGAQLFASATHACAVQDSHLSCWGRNVNGQLGIDESIVRRTPISLPGLPNVTSISTAGQSAGSLIFRSLHGCAVANGALYCWGDNIFGELGFATRGPFPTPRLVGLTSVTEVHTESQGTITIAGGQAYAFGSNVSGRLGNGDTDPLRTPTLVDLAGTEDEVGLGDRYGCARQGGSVYCWGSDSAGQLGRGAAVAGNSDLSPGEAVVSVSDALQLAVGYEFSCVRRATAVSCWGSNVQSQLGSPTPTLSRTPLDIGGVAFPLDVSVGYRHACAISRTGDAATSGQVICWGGNAEGQAGGPPTAAIAPTPVVGLSDAVSVAAYHFHSCAIREDGSVWCWGHNDNHQFGNGTNVDSQVPVQVTGITNAAQLGAGGAGRINTCATLETGEAMCWGGCWGGGCGTGESILRLAPMEVSGL